MQDVFSAFPVWVLALDYILGVVMWTLIGRSAMNLFLPEDSDFFFMKAFVRLTDPILKVFKPITPGFLLSITVPLYVAWFFFMVRFYLMPWLLGYSVMGMLSFPLEGEIARAIYGFGK
ncbi:MAG: YggT family protein [Fimbriimonadaceae bacterium]|nr:YggT family protein [Alphaproteobacteria bacterium]